MTNEQIIIDGIDVSGCEFYLPYSEKCECIVDDNGNNNLFCREYRDCYYKRMYHTGQEKDIYKNENKELYKQLKAKEQECEELKKENYELTEEVSIDRALFAEIDQLKAERDGYLDKYFLESQKVVNLKKVLKEIKDFVQKEIEYFEHDIEYQYDWKELMKLIKINEVEHE